MDELPKTIKKQKKKKKALLEALLQTACNPYLNNRPTPVLLRHYHICNNSWVQTTLSQLYLQTLVYILPSPVDVHEQSN